MKRPDRGKNIIFESKTKSESGIDLKRNYKKKLLHCVFQNPKTRHEEEYKRPDIIRNNENQCRTRTNKQNQETCASGK